MENIIQVNNLTKEFIIKRHTGMFSRTKEIKKAVTNINFNIDSKDIVAFIGPNGAGKSTTIKMLTGILSQTSGSINVLGLDPHKNRRQLSYNIGTMFGQKSQLWFHLPAMDSFNLLGHIYDIDKSLLNKRIAQISEIMDITDLLDIPVRKLSLGQRVRCEVAASLLHNPKILFLDEPTIGLDIISKKNLRNLIKRINEEEGTTIFLTSHDIGDIENICERIIVVNQGNIVLDNNIHTVKNMYDSNKLIYIDFCNEDNLKNIKLPQVKQLSKNKICIESKAHEINSIISEIAQFGHIENIEISSKPLEDIIEQIYDKSVGESL